LESLTAHAAASGLSIPDVLTTAAQYYLREPYSDRMSLRVPRFARAADDGRSGDLELALSLPESTFEELGNRAIVEGVSITRLLEHAALVYLADVDSGQLAERILERAEADLQAEALTPPRP
jgi:hypothetical protein